MPSPRCHILFFLIATWLWAEVVPAQTLLEGEFGDVDLGREWIGPSRFPTLSELRAAVRLPQMHPVAMFKLYGDQDNHHLPIWSHDGQRLAFQRSKVGANSSKLLIFDSLGQAEPTLLTKDNDAYDFMFRWGRNSETSFVFVRIEAGRKATRLYFSADGRNLEGRPQDGLVQYPALYQWTDGTQRLAFERNGEIVHQTWNANGNQEKILTRGTSPRWSVDGKRLLLARDVGGPGNLAIYQPVEHDLVREHETALPVSHGAVVRSPVYSPDEQSAAWFEREPREGAPWRVRVCRIATDAQPKTVASDIIVNPDFKTEGPCWEPSGQRLWCFSNAHRREQFFPLVAVAAESGKVTLVEYPVLVTSPHDVAANPKTPVPELAFVGRLGVTQDLFVLFLNHY